MGSKNPVSVQLIRGTRRLKKPRALTGPGFMGVTLGAPWKGPLGRLFGAYWTSVPVKTPTTRRFSARPAEVSLVAIGLLSP